MGGLIAFAGYNYWKYDSDRMNINTAGPGLTTSRNNVRPLYVKGPSKSYSTNKSYQFVTNQQFLYDAAPSASFSVTTPWNDKLSYVNGMTASGSTTPQSFFHYSTPTTNLTSTNRVTFEANGWFEGTRGIRNFTLNEIDFNILGFSYYRSSSNLLANSMPNSLGWHYDSASDIYFWSDRVTGSPSTIINATSAGYFPVGGSNGNKTSNIGYRLNNALYKFVPYTNFNFTFGYQNSGNFPLRIYLSKSLPSLSPASWTKLVSGVYTPPSNSILIATLTQSVASDGSTSATSSVSHQFFGVSGNQYIIFVGGFAGASASGTTSSSIYLKNLQISGGYHPGNNRQYLMTNSATNSTTSLTGATYAALVGTGNTVNATASLTNPGISKILSKLGNGTFRSGIWENGVWNSGWRVDDKMKEFYEVSQFFSYNSGKRWRVQITGPASSATEFNIGDNVSISNIVPIDINDERKIIKGYYTVINKTQNSIIVEFDANFPIRRIEKDSDNHRIYVTKNVWLSGGFLNGYFTGIWNYGLFKGYPLITEMYNTQWIDGIFDGGHFSTDVYTIPPFVDTIFSSGNVGLTFSSPHRLAIGDVITIKMDVPVGSLEPVNPQYDGEYNVTSVVNDYHLVTDIPWGSDTSGESGQITTSLTTGLLQKVDFKSNNISRITSNLSMDSNSVFVYNSWMNVVYDDSSATNIGRPQSISNLVSRRSYSVNNLYGFITNDVLESSSSFRDSFSTSIRKYRLGTKYKIFADFIGDAGNFKEDFGGELGDTEILKYGWTFSRTSTNSLLLKRTIEDEESSEQIGEELGVTSIKDGGILDITNDTEFDVLNKTYENIESLRYTMVEFNLGTYSISVNNTTNVLVGTISAFGLSFSIYETHLAYLYRYNSLATNSGFLSIGSLFSNTIPLYGPPIHFNNLNLVNRLSSSGLNVLTQATYLPVYNNVNHLITKRKKKVEYFYNKRNLSMNFMGYAKPSADPIDYIIDNLHFYEVDMIPFFSYFTEDNINKGIVVPFQGISPFIDYSNANFSFIDNISIGLDSIQTQNSNTVVSGVGAGVGAGGGISTSSMAVLDPGSVIFSPSPVGSGGFSDIRLKENINLVGKSLSGINIYEWNYINDVNRFRGVVAQELLGTKFESSLSIKQGFYFVDYTDLDVKFEKI